MNEANKIATVLNALWSDEVDILGASTVSDVARSVVSGGDFVRSRGGANMDAAATLEFLLQAATLVKVTIEIWNLLVKRSGNAPAKSDVESEVEKDPRVRTIDGEIRRRLSEIVKAISRSD